MSQLGVVEHDNLVAGEFPVVTEPITIAVSQTILRGDVLIKTAGKYGKATAVILATDAVVIASEDITTDAATTVQSIGYRTGSFNEYAVRFGGASTADQNRDLLADKSIYLAKSQK